MTRSRNEESALLDREVRVRHLANALPVPVALIDRELNYVFVNWELADWLGKTPDELRGRSVKETGLEVLTEAIVDSAKSHIGAVLGGEERRFGGRVRHRDGTIRDIEMILAPARDEDGAEYGFYSLTFDHTEGVRAKSARDLLTAAEAILTASFDADLVVQGVVLLATAGFSDRCTAFLKDPVGHIRCFASGGQADTCEERRIGAAVLPDAVRQVMHQDYTVSYGVLTDRAEHVVAPLLCAERGGGALLFQWDAPFDVQTRELAIAKDIGLRLAGALDRIELYRRTHDAVHARDWLLHKVTHDLGNPVASIVMVAERLLRTAPTPDRRTRTRPFLEGIARQAKEMELIVGDLLDASALRTGHVKVRPRTIDSGGVVHEAISLMEPIALSRRMELHADLPTRSLNVKADPHHLHRALSALISEALAWGDDAGRVCVQVAPFGNEVVFHVIGPGPHMSADELSRLLASLASGKTGEAELRARVGLSLLIGSEIVRAQGAKLQVSHGADGETSYTFALPAASQPMESAADHEP